MNNLQFDAILSKIFVINIRLSITKLCSLTGFNSHCAFVSNYLKQQKKYKSEEKNLVVLFKLKS